MEQLALNSSDFKRERDDNVHLRNLVATTATEDERSFGCNFRDFPDALLFQSTA